MQADLTPLSAATKSAATKSAAKSARGGPPRRIRSLSNNANVVSCRRCSSCKVAE
jgi:hypothetical protein